MTSVIGIGMVGKIIGGKKAVELNPEIYPTESETQCLNDRIVGLLRRQYDGLVKLPDHVLNTFEVHIDGCCACRDLVAKEIRSTHAVVVSLLEEDSLHTSLPPEQACRPFCKTHRVAKLKDIKDWSEVRVH